ncbi:caffeic acid 3-O-methyltransferase-like protein [Tanacetum coccineum]
MQLVTSSSLPMVLLNAIKLKVLDTIAEAGPNACLSAHEIASCLSIRNPDAPDMLDRMLHLLASHSIVTCTQLEHELKPVDMELVQRGEVFIESWFKLKDCVLEGEILKCYNGFDNLNSLVDVGGGLGVTINMIVSKYPLIKGINYDLPHVIKHAPQYHGIENVGDMFQDVPQVDAIFMKVF